MQEVIRLKKLEERREIDRQVNQGLLMIGSPDIKKYRNEGNSHKSMRHELSEIANHLASNRSQHRGESILRSSQDNDHNSSSPYSHQAKLKHEDILNLESKCQRMVFEKDDQFLENEKKLKNEDLALRNLEEELLMIEQRLKEKNQENNLVDFKLRQVVRNNQEIGFLKPHSGIH